MDNFDFENIGKIFEKLLVDENDNYICHRDALRAAGTEKLIRETVPYARPRKNYTKTLDSYIATKNYYENQTKITPEQKINQLTGPRHCSVRRLDQLEPIRLKDMYVNKHHIGKYLLCRTIVEPFYMTAMSLLVEDEDGKIENLSIYNYSTSYDIPPSDLLPLNTVMIIKEPYLKIMIHDNNNYFIRVESPTDIVILDDDGHSVQKWKIQLPKRTYSELNERGNKCFVTKQFRQAIRLYNQALKVFWKCFFFIF